MQFLVEKGRDVLVVDDDPIVHKMLSAGLERKDLRVACAGSVEEATKALNETRYSLAIIDKNLPDGSGVDVMKIAHGIDPTTEILLITIDPSLDSAVAALKLGAYDYLAKPLVLDTVVHRVEGALLRQRLHRSYALLTSRIVELSTPLTKNLDAMAESVEHMNAFSRDLLGHIENLEKRLNSVKEQRPSEKADEFEQFFCEVGDLLAAVKQLQERMVSAEASSDDLREMRAAASELETLSHDSSDHDTKN